MALPCAPLGTSPAYCGLSTPPGQSLNPSKVTDLVRNPGPQARLLPPEGAGQALLPSRLSEVNKSPPSSTKGCQEETQGRIQSPFSPPFLPPLNSNGGEGWGGGSWDLPSPWPLLPPGSPGRQPCSGGQTGRDPGSASSEPGACRHVTAARASVVAVKWCHKTAFRGGGGMEVATSAAGRGSRGRGMRGNGCSTRSEPCCPRAVG